MFGQREKHHNWKGGRYLHNGYVMVLVEKGKYVREHRKIVEDFLGRPLPSNEKIHHINGIRTDNRIENLEIYTNSDHTKLHWEKGDYKETHIQRPQATCHPNRPHHAKGLCHKCYMNLAYKKYASKNRH